MEPTPAYVFKATYLENHDGDNVLLALDHGKFPKSKAVTEAELRIKGLFCPELKESGGPEALAYARLLWTSARRIVAQTYKGSFERTVADVWIDGVLFADAMILAGHGRPG